MTSVWSEDGKHIPVTILALEKPQVTAVKKQSIHGYSALEIGSGWRANAAKKLRRSVLGNYAAKGVAPKRKLGEFRVSSDQGLLPVGTFLKADWFREGQFVDVQAKSLGKGFAGVMKRWGFKGLPASHGVSLKHRSMGSAGSSQDPGRVIPGKKMAGRMGGQMRTVQNVKVIAVDPELDVILVKGQVPGPDKGYVKIWDSIKKKTPEHALEFVKNSEQELKIKV